MNDSILEGIGYSIPALVTGVVSYIVMIGLRNQKTTEKRLVLLQQKKKESLLIRLQAYERMLLFCERINPEKMVHRIQPIGDNAKTYLKLLLANIEQEFQHNIIQQLYLTDACWNVIKDSKNALIDQLKLLSEASSSSSELREKVSVEYTKKAPSTEIAIAFIKDEVRSII